MIRRPECLGPSLCGEGGQGLLAGINEALEICRDPRKDEPDRKIARYQQVTILKLTKLIFNEIFP